MISWNNTQCFESYAAAWARASDTTKMNVGGRSNFPIRIIVQKIQAVQTPTTGSITNQVENSIQKGTFESALEQT